MCDWDRAKISEFEQELKLWPPAKDAFCNQEWFDLICANILTLLLSQSVRIFCCPTYTFYMESCQPVTYFRFLRTNSWLVVIFHYLRCVCVQEKQENPSIESQERRKEEKEDGSPGPEYSTQGSISRELFCKQKPTLGQVSFWEYCEV